MTLEQGLLKVLDLYTRSRGGQLDTVVLWYRDEAGHLKIEVLRNLEQKEETADRRLAGAAEKV